MAAAFQESTPYERNVFFESDSLGLYKTLPKDSLVSPNHSQLLGADGRTPSAPQFPRHCGGALNCLPPPLPKASLWHGLGVCFMSSAQVGAQASVLWTTQMVTNKEQSQHHMTRDRTSKLPHC